MGTVIRENCLYKFLDGTTKMCTTCGETFIDTRFKKCHQHIRLFHTDKSTVGQAQHQIGLPHPVSGYQDLDHEIQTHGTRDYKEVETEFHSDNMNREGMKEVPLL